MNLPGRVQVHEALLRLGSSSSSERGVPGGVAPTLAEPAEEPASVRPSQRGSEVAQDTGSALEGAADDAYGAAVDEWMKGRSNYGQVKWGTAEAVDVLFRRKEGSTYVFAPRFWKREEFPPEGWAAVRAWFHVEGRDHPKASIALKAVAVAANPNVGAPEIRGKIELSS